MSHAMLVLLTATHNMPDYRTLRQFACATMRRLSSIHTLMIGWPGVTSRPRSSYAVCVYKYTCLQHLFIASLLCPEMGAAGPTLIFPCLTLTLLVLTNKLVPWEIVSTLTETCLSLANFVYIDKQICFAFSWTDAEQRQVAWPWQWTPLWRHLGTLQHVSPNRLRHNTHLRAIDPGSGFTAHVLYSGAHDRSSLDSCWG